jgi:lauroyl/myristoyl acyltransferase
MNLKYFILRLVFLTASSIPERFGYSLAEFSGYALYLFSTKRRDVVRNNMKRALGLEREKTKLRREVRHVFQNVAKNYFDLIKLSRTRLNKFDGKFKIEGWHNLAKAVEDGKGVIIATAHLGNFEAGVQALVSRGIDISVLVEAFETTPFLRNIAVLRQSNGVKILPVNGRGLKEGLRILNHGGIIAIVSDRDVQGNGIKVNFLGKVTPLPYGAISLALRTGAAVVPVFSIRASGRSCSIHIEPPLRLIEHEDRDQSLRVNVEQLVSVMEKYIRRYPEQWTVLEPV